ncbi:hypothetical protein ACFDR9_002515 [Janthinobacterium sp. CG_23.3]|uniref:hypothetical protein n=1 Tax=unclassified Janthinobacterium TaxID=2610881 RepID=UPI00034AF698|nr:MULTISPECIES: hypothetical protein [unclassified Janthinobacterium]MEC5162136.1 hypothetical protein [Janthinobacterium sp. CG_S6]
MTAPQPTTQQGRNSAMDKTDAERERGDPYANQGGGKLGSGNVNSGHPANDVITRADSAKTRADTARSTEVVGANVKGSGMPTRSGAGKLADDRPGRNDPKSEHASSSRNTHEE